MGSQKLLIRVVLGVLGVGVAVALVTAVAMPDDDFLGAAIVTAICAAGAAGTIVLSTHWLAPRTRPRVVYTLWATSLGGAAMVAGGFWAGAMDAYRMAEALLVCGFGAAILGVPAAVAVHHLDRPRRRFACLAALASLPLALGAWFGMSAFSYGNWHVSELFMVAGWCAIFYGGLATAQLIGCDPRAARTWWRFGFVAVSIAAGAVLICAVAYAWDQHAWVPIFAVLSALAIAPAQANLVMQTPIPVRFHGLPWVAVVAGLLACGSGAYWMIYAVYAGDFWYGDVLPRVATALAILAGALTVAVLGIAWMSRVTPRERHVYLDDLRMMLACPRCGVGQTVGSGHGACVGCGLWLHVQFEEPRCPNCDYLLYHAAGDACPECGHELRIPRGTRSDGQQDAVATAATARSATSP